LRATCQWFLQIEAARHREFPFEAVTREPPDKPHPLDATPACVEV